MAKAASWSAMLYLVIFLWFSLNLLISIIRTIGTNPGNIPEDREWDMDYVQSQQKANESEEEDEEEKKPLTKPEGAGEE